ncbi:unnamed protein product [Tenebrio molitor]|nr:unnamed protein product [Tenebrio molitor]
MLPATLVTFATFLLELCATSPVYNMQPAFITANIGTAGRNIRNLPCISRKTNQSGVCMFAIDCLKANGTHLGTCIDRFYFGSCCHTEPVHDIIENTIDIDIIPAREPPQRLSSTIRPIPTTSTKTETTPTKKTTSAAKISTEKPKPVKQDETTTVSYKLTTFQSVDGSIPPETTTKPSTTPKPKPTTPKSTSKPKPTKTTTKPTKATPKPTRATTTTKKPVSTTHKLVVSTTRKPSTTTTTRKPSSTTRRPTTTAVRRPSTSATRKPSTSATRKPSTSVTSKPSTNATRKPSTTATRKPSTSAAHKPSTSATRKPSTSGTRKPSTSTTRKPSTIVTKKPSPVTTRKPVATPRPTTKVPTTRPVKITAATTRKPSSTTTTTVKPSTVLDRNSTEGSVTGGNLVSNEIETASSTEKPSSTTSGTIVTWTISDRNVSVATTSSPSNSTSEEWVPITTPDNWVPLPSVQPSPAQGTSSSSAPPSSGTATTESSGKPSITYIPLVSTTPSSPAPNASTAEGIITSASTPATGAPPPTTTDSEIRPVNMSDFTDVCGRRMYPEGRIVGGEKASFGKWPWQISLRQWRTSTYLHKCGAALLNENWAITAAHCVDNVPPSDLLLRLGEHDLSTESEPYLHQERRVQIVASHPQFDPRTFEYDLALLRFYEPVTFQPNILPVCVPQTDENFVGRTAYVTGWGRLYEDGPLPSILQEVSVPVINNSVCESMYRSAGYIEHIPHIFICAGWRRGGFDSCEGDSGGPMVIQRDDKRFLLAGVISWGIGCAEPNQPGVYTRISEFRDWINQILQF